MSKTVKVCIDKIPSNLSKEISLINQYKWEPGQTIHVRFLEGVPEVKEKVKKHAKRWEQYANIKLEFGNNPDAEIRIAFDMNDGSWSYIGTSCKEVAKNEPTMNYGWLQPDTPEVEYSRVVLHEFGHALGCIHEHQNPSAKIPWDKEAVYTYYMGPPNNWSKEDVDNNIFNRYDKNLTSFTEFDPTSIMLYTIPNEHTIGDYEAIGGVTFSEKDKQFIQQMYPF
ncbi:M12 family metallopeptidase [Lysinibacillus parviboronicapiens]|uniref:Serralysin n=1 Tax=Lysinibacillus parviboronicapiens TaxID=436516 RepID=A0ABV2PGB9_9BACI|nr:M12 family metallopeptidase [Lysinibacillus parviboronicapiens]